MSVCDDARKQMTDAVDKAVDPLMQDAGVIVKHMQDKGLDPTKYYDAAHDQFVDLVAYLKALGDLKTQKLNEVNTKADECQDSADKVAFLQQGMDFTVSVITGGISDLLPQYMTHIDVAEILSGHPLGGDNSVINQVRGSVLNALGIAPGSDLFKAITDPVHATTDVVNQVIKTITGIIPVLPLPALPPVHIDWPHF
ncbi:hypothetical protein M3A49_01005 [Paraburkholderia sp. CNPSo 3076]|uniref:hypothetical protein n=1 Tax=Paraburkholderia sp. CNPSo 3076 TaxID=2940936 RepID=UPI00224D2260|nr:hypothetical protein [Paraburkholderia sp. CNPSo 3076]MCX5538090.1 hypothetical protein [Paraburkholderia sp. CNPSo 3076]